MYCIYKIENIVNKKYYIGKTKNFEKRKSRHFSELRHNKHHCIYLQRAVNKYGIENFKMFIVLDNLTEEEAYIKETEYILNDYDNNYNVSKESSGGDLLSYHPNREQIIEKISISGKNSYNSKPTNNCT